MTDGITSHRMALAMVAGFLLPWQMVWIIRPGMLGGVPWPLATIGLYAGDVVLLVAAVAGIVSAWRSRPQRLLIACAFIGIVMVWNIAVSFDSALSMIGWARIIVLLLALAGLPYSRNITRAFIGGFLVAILGHAFLGIMQFFTLQSTASTMLGIAHHDAWTLGDAVIMGAGGRWLRAYGGFPHPNVFGTALLVAMIVAVRQGTSDKVQVTKTDFALHSSFFTHHSSLITSYFLLLTFSLVLTFSRAALLGLIILLIILARRIETRRLAIVGTAMLAVAIALTWSFWVPRATITNANETRSFIERTDALRSAGVLFLQRPLIGTGLHAMPAARYDLARDFAEVESGVFPDPYTAQPMHDVPLLAFVELGLLGFILLGIIIVFLLHHSSLITHHSSLLWLSLLPSLLFDHALWSLAIGPVLLFVFLMSMSLDNASNLE